jgi:hypothetical protein
LAEQGWFDGSITPAFVVALIGRCPVMQISRGIPIDLLVFVATAALGDDGVQGRVQSLSAGEEGVLSLLE